MQNKNRTKTASSWHEHKFMFKQNLSVDTDHSPHKLSTSREHTVPHHTANMGCSLSFFSFSHSLTFTKTHHQTIVQHQGSVELGNQGKWNSASFNRTKICSIENCKKERLFSSERERDAEERRSLEERESSSVRIFRTATYYSEAGLIF